MSGAEASSEPLLEFREMMRRLRAECGWKREQTHRSLSRYLVEELHETLEALDTWEHAADPLDPGPAEHLCEELGDLLLQVYFHAVIAEETGAFTLDDVARGIAEKMRRRNPHVYSPEGEPPAAGSAALDPAAINEVWQEIKAAEKARSSLTDGLPASLPALLYADKVLDRLARERGTLAVEEVAQQPSPDLGDRLLALVAEAHDAGVDPEQALRDAVRRVL